MTARIDELVARAHEDGVRMIRFLRCDPSGVIRGKNVHVNKLVGKMREGVGVTRAQNAVNMVAQLVHVPEIAPFAKVLFSSDAWGLPDLHVLGSWLVRRGLSRVIGRWAADGDRTLADAARAIELLAQENARRVYTRIATG